MKRKNKGYVLLIVLILSIIIAIIGAGLALMNKQGFLSTRANTLFNKLQKAAHYGIMENIRRIIIAGGMCEQGIVNDNIKVGDANVRLSTSRWGLLCFLRAEATLGGARQVIVATTQGFYGIGTFTVKAKERVKWIGNAYVSGCDPNNRCNIPGIIVSGPIDGVPPNMQRTCDQTGSTGIFGSPPTKPNVRFHDLVPLTFNVNCFYHLLKMFETEDNYKGYPMGLGRNPFWRNTNGTARQDINFDKTGLDPTCTLPDEPRTVWDNRIGSFTINDWDDEIPDISSACEFNGDTLNLSQDLVNCNWIRVKKDVTINGIAPNIKFIDARNYKVIIENAGNANIFTDRPITINSKTNSYPLVLYTTGNVNINGQATLIRVISQGNINLNTAFTISNSTLITPNSIVNNNYNNLTLRELNVFARSINFTRTTTIEGGMFYLFGYVENVCNSSDPDSSNITTNANIGTLSNPVLFIMVNSNLRVVNNTPIYFNGVFFAEGPTCIVYSNIRFVGISIWNEPNDFVNVDQLGSGFYIQFNYGIINTLNAKYWFVRKFECIRDDPLPYAQTIWTYHSSY